MVCLSYKLIYRHLIRICCYGLSKKGEIEVHIKLQFGDSQTTSSYSIAFKAACARRGHSPVSGSLLPKLVRVQKTGSDGHTLRA
jgi:hypothetical protein